jgi:hypothetical protein
VPINGVISNFALVRQRALINSRRSTMALPHTLDVPPGPAEISRLERYDVEKSNKWLRGNGDGHAVLPCLATMTSYVQVSFEHIFSF